MTNDTTTPQAQHTAGPWHLTKLEIADSKNVFVASVEGEIPTEYDRANAHLIAAAPELLNAVVDAQNWFNDQQDTDDESYSAMSRLMEKAISKARGE